jgi:hypothetical protein
MKATGRYLIVSALRAFQHRGAIRPWLDEPRLSLYRPSGSEQPSPRNRDRI